MKVLLVLLSIFIIITSTVSAQTYHRADTTEDGCVDLDEMLAFMNRWKVSVADVSMPELMSAIALWKAGTGCSLTNSFREDFNDDSMIETLSDTEISSGFLSPTSISSGEVEADDSTVLLMHLNGSLVDESPNGFQPYFSGTLDYIADGNFGQALAFESNCINIDDDPAFHFGSDRDFSVSFWFRKTEPSTDREIMIGKRSGLTGFGISHVSDSIEVVFVDGTEWYSFYSTDSYIDGNWHNVVVNFDRSNFAVLYVDGKEIAGMGISGIGNIDTTSKLKIGYPEYVGAPYFNGDLDEIVVYDRLLSEDEISENVFGDPSSAVSKKIKPTTPIESLDSVSWSGNGDFSIKISLDKKAWHDVNPDGTVDSSEIGFPANLFYYKVVFNDIESEIDWIDFSWTDYEGEEMPDPDLEFNLTGKREFYGIGTNLCYGDQHYYSKAVFFADAMKRATPWNIRQHPNWESRISADLSDYLDENGWPLYAPITFDNGTDILENMVFSTILYLDAGAVHPAGEYVLLFEGDGTIQLSGDSGYHEIDSDGSSEKRHVFDVTPSWVIILEILRSNVDNPVRNIRVILPGYEDKYQENPFYQPYVDKLSNYNVARFVQSLYTNENQKVDSWDDVRPIDYYTQIGEYPEDSGNEPGANPYYLFEISNIAEVDPWINIPHLANDDYIRNIAKLAHETLDPDRKVYLEFSNELWNGVFPQAHYPQTGRLNLDFWAQRSAAIFRIFEEEFGGTDRIVRVLATQGGNSYVGNSYLREFYDKSNNPWAVRADVLAIAPYFGGSLLKEIIDNGEVETTTADDILNELETLMPQVMPLVLNNHKAMAEKYNMSIISYEGGSELYTSNKTLEAVAIEASYDPRMKDIYDDFLNMWFDNGGGLFISYCFISDIPISTFLNSDQDISTSPKFQALIGQKYRWE